LSVTLGFVLAKRMLTPGNIRNQYSVINDVL
jgi:hypothetical protein